MSENKIEKGVVDTPSVEEIVSADGSNLIYVPKKIFYWDGAEINNAMFNNLVQFVNDYGVENVIEIWLNSPGGNCVVGEMVRDLVEEFQIPIVACGLIGSAAFNLFISANTSKRIVNSTIAIYHRTYLPGMILNKDFKPMIDKEFKRVNSSHYRSVEETVEKIPLTPTQKRKFKRDEDIYFVYEELVEILKGLNDENFILDNQEVSEN